MNQRFNFPPRSPVGYVTPMVYVKDKNSVGVQNAFSQPLERRSAKRGGIE
jgi:hypothetical protein